MGRKRAEKEEKWKVKKKYSNQAKKKRQGPRKMTAHRQNVVYNMRRKRAEKEVESKEKIFNLGKKKRLEPRK